MFLAWTVGLVISLCPKVFVADFTLFLGVKKKCQELGITLLGDIPLHAQICSDADAGKPTVVGSPNSPQAEAFTQLARDLKTTLGL
jgi:nitrogenase subunit NifH